MVMVMVTVMEEGQARSPEPGAEQIRQKVLKTLEKLDVEPS